MNQHLSSEQISRCLIGDRTPIEARHLAECAACAAELERVEASLAAFRASVHETSIRTMRADGREWTAPRRSPFSMWMGWPVIAAVLVILTVVPLWRVRSSANRAAQTAREDAALMMDISAAVSRSVPEPMEPLAQLWTKDAGQQDRAVRSENQ